MEARLIQDIDFTDEDMDRVERETASLLREGLIQRIALREAELATLRARNEWLEGQVKMHKEIADNQTFHANARMEKIAGLLDEASTLRELLRRTYPAVVTCTDKEVSGCQFYKRYEELREELRPILGELHAKG